MNIVQYEIMNTLPLQHINSVDDVAFFFHHLVADRKVNFHPDDPFDYYISHSNGEPTFTPEECKHYDQLMAEAFSVCENDNVDIYELCMKELMPEFEM